MALTVVAGYAAPTALAARLVGVMVMAGLITKPTLDTCWVALESFTVIKPVPLAVGVPLRTPVEGLKVRPAGTVADMT